MTVPPQSTADGHQPGPGLIVFGDSLQLRFVNQRARDLLGGAPSVEQGSACDEVTLEILQMSELLLRRLRDLLVDQDWSYADLHKEIPLEDKLLDIRAFGFAGLSRRDEVHIVMLLNTVGSKGSFAHSKPPNYRNSPMPMER